MSWVWILTLSFICCVALNFSFLSCKMGIVILLCTELWRLNSSLVSGIYDIKWLDNDFKSLLKTERGGGIYQAQKCLRKSIVNDPGKSEALEMGAEPRFHAQKRQGQYGRAQHGTGPGTRDKGVGGVTKTRWRNSHSKKLRLVSSQLQMKNQDLVLHILPTTT